MFPFINMWWKRDKVTGINWNWKITDHIRDFERAQREYDDRMAKFETHLYDCGLYQEYMDLRNAANRLVLQQNRMDFTKEMIERKDI